MTIVGIEVRVERAEGGAGTIRDHSVRLYRGGFVGDNKAAAEDWPASDTVKVYGSPTDLWGTTWTREQINLSTFGVGVAAQLVSGSDGEAQIDQVTVTVYYEDPSRRGRVSWVEVETPDAARRARVAWTEIETPDAARRARVGWIEIETPDAPRRALASWVEIEVPDSPVTDRRSRVSWSEIELPDAPRRVRSAWAEMEVPDAPSRGRVSWTEIEVPDDPTSRRGRVSWAALAVGNLPGEWTSAVWRLALANRSADGINGLGEVIVEDVLGSLGVIHGDDAPAVVTWALNGWGSIVFTVPITAPDPDVYLTGGARELHLYRDIGAGEELVAAGHLWRADIARSSVRFTGYGWPFTLWNKRELRHDKDYENNGDGTDVYDIARDLIQYTQAKEHGDLGITFASTADHGKARKLVVCAEETRKIGDIISELADADNGFDWEITPDKVWTTYKPKRGSTLADVVFDGVENIDDVSWTIDGENIENDIAGVGEVKDCEPIHMSEWTAPESQETYGLLESSFHRPDLRWDSDHLDDLAKDRRRRRKRPINQPTFRVPRALGGPVPLVDYNLGDTVTVRSSRGYATLDTTARVISISTRITQAQNEYDEVEFDFAEEPA